MNHKLRVLRGLQGHDEVPINRIFVMPRQQSFLTSVSSSDSIGSVPQIDHHNQLSRVKPSARGLDDRLKLREDYDPFLSDCLCDQEPKGRIRMRSGSITAKWSGQSVRDRIRSAIRVPAATGGGIGRRSRTTPQPGGKAAR